MGREMMDHGTTLGGAAKVVIRKDDFIPSRPWHADVVFEDGSKWVGWQSFFRTRKSLVTAAREALDSAGMHDAEIVCA